MQIRSIFIDLCCPWNPQHRALAYTRARFSSFCHVAFQNIPEASKMRPKDLPRAVWEALGRALGLSWAPLGCSWGTLGLFLGSKTRQKNRKGFKNRWKYQKVLNNFLWKRLGLNLGDLGPTFWALGFKFCPPGYKFKRFLLIWSFKIDCPIWISPLPVLTTIMVPLGSSSLI